MGLTKKIWKHSSDILSAIHSSYVGLEATRPRWDRFLSPGPVLRQNIHVRCVNVARAPEPRSTAEHNQCVCVEFLRAEQVDQLNRTRTQFKLISLFVHYIKKIWTVDVSVNQIWLKAFSYVSESYLKKSFK